MKTVLILIPLLWELHAAGNDGFGSTSGLASWYGEAHRGKPIANGQPFDPDRLTAASWFYPLGTAVRVSLASEPRRSVVVTVTDRGPARRLVRAGRVIDLSHAAFSQLADPDVGLVEVNVVGTKGKR